MRFMIMHKNDPHTEAGERPPKDLVEKMGQLDERFIVRKEKEAHGNGRKSKAA